jgi:Ca2+-binding RTX toxin-like protein
LGGGAGQDTLTGGEGSDIFRFDTALDAVANVGTILDFSAADDSIWLDDAVFSVLSALRQPASSASKDTAAGAKDADDRIVYNSATGNLYYDADGSGIAYGNVKFATLSSAPGLAAADFIVV